jgi:hypothetical protein
MGLTLIGIINGNVHGLIWIIKCYEVKLLKKNLTLKIVPKKKKMISSYLECNDSSDLFIFLLYIFLWRFKKANVKKYLTYTYYKMKRPIIVSRCMEIKG